MWNAGWNGYSGDIHYSNFISIQSPHSQSSTYSMDSGYSGLMEQSSSPSQVLTTLQQSPSLIHSAGSHHVMQAFNDFNDHDSFHGSIPEFYGPQAPVTIDYSPFLSPSPATVPINTFNAGCTKQMPEIMPTPHLEIVEQPADKPFRFRYKSEMHGTHGSLMGISTERSKRTYPTVALRNFNFASKAMIRCSLYQVPNEAGALKRSPHSHKLVIRRGDIEESDPHDIEVSNQNDFTAVFQGMGIIHTAKRYIKDELCKKIRAETEFEENRQISVSESAAIQREAEKLSKEMNLNQVCLCFQAYIKHEVDQNWIRICEPVYSKIVNNMKSALTGELRITRMSTYTSQVSGGQEVFMFVEKVCKNNIKVKFYETDESGNVHWEDFGVFNEADVHHQYGIVLKTPPYKKMTIDEPVVVNVQLFRPSDGSTSEPLEFRYKPNIQAGVKRRRSNSSEYIPTVIGAHELSSQDNTSTSICGARQNNSQSFGNKFNQSGQNQSYDFEESLFDSLPSYFGTFSAQTDLTFSSSEFKGLWQCSPEEFCRLLEIEIDGESKLQIDGTGHAVVDSSSDMCCSLLDKLKLLIKLFRNNFDDEKLHEMIMVLIKAQVETGGNILIDCIQHGTVDEIKTLVKILIKYKFMDVLKSLNDLDQNCFHVLILAGYSNLLKIFLSLGVDINQADAFGQTPLHLAALQTNKDSVEKLLDDSTNLKLNELNDDGFTPLHLAVKSQNFSIVMILIEAGADVQKRSPLTGDNVLHMAVADGEPNMQIINYLIENNENLLYQENHSRMNVLQIASNNNQSDDLIQLLAGYYEESYTKKKDVDGDDDSTSESDNEYVEGPSPEPLFDERCLQELCRIFDVDDKWKGVLIVMGLEEKIDEWESERSPSMNVFKYSEKNHKSLDFVVEILDMLEERRAIAVIDEMIVRKFDK